MDERCNEVLVRELCTALNTGDVERAVACFTDDGRVMDVSLEVLAEGASDIRELWHTWLHAFPDLHLHVYHTVKGTEGCVAYWMLEGTHQAAFMHVPPTGRSVKAPGFLMTQTAGGRIQWAVCLWDAAGMLRDMRLLPALRHDGPLPAWTPAAFLGDDA